LQIQQERLSMAKCLAVCKMASLCKRQQCTIERRGFRQELDSWRHKLIHCVGFESILEAFLEYFGHAIFNHALHTHIYTLSPK
uniref:Uncharacterized protein n=1 Tax=Pundamilia nyererei TaxID=303518 RepID=A0A3B4EU57_9CICH